MRLRRAVSSITRGLNHCCRTQAALLQNPYFPAWEPSLGPHSSSWKSTFVLEPTVLGTQRAVTVNGKKPLPCWLALLPPCRMAQQRHLPTPCPHGLALWPQEVRSSRMAGPVLAQRWVFKDIKISIQCASKLPEKARVGEQSRAKLSAGRGEPPAERETQEGSGPPN